MVKLTMPHNPIADIGEIENRADLAEELKGALERARKLAENWKNGMAGLIALVTATLLFKGQDKITAYELWVQVGLGILAIAALILAVWSVWHFLQAAYGKMIEVSADELVSMGPKVARDITLTNQTLDDLKWAQKLALGSAIALALAIGLSWYGPVAESKPLAFMKIEVNGATTAEAPRTVCGELISQEGTATVLKVKASADNANIPTSRIRSAALVSSCASAEK